MICLLFCMCSNVHLMAEKSKRVHRILWNLRYSLFWAAVWVLGTELKSSEKTASAFNCQTITLVSKCIIHLFIYLLYNMVPSVCEFWKDLSSKWCLFVFTSLLLFSSFHSKSAHRDKARASFFFSSPSSPYPYLFLIKVENFQLVLVSLGVHFPITVKKNQTAGWYWNYFFVDFYFTLSLHLQKHWPHADLYWCNPLVPWEIHSHLGGYSKHIDNNVLWGRDEKKP